MIDNESIIVKTNEFDVVDLDDEKVIMNMEKGKYFSLNAMASIILEFIDKETSVKNIVNFLTNEYDVEKKKCEECVIEYLNDLEKIDLIKVM